MRKNLVIIAIVLLSALPLAVLASGFVANGNITVKLVTFALTTTDLTILSGSTADSWSYSSGSFSVTNPGSAFEVAGSASDSTVGTLTVKDSTNTVVVCEVNTTPGTSYVTLPTTAGTYTVVPSSATSCADSCPRINGASTYNAWPTCGAATCDGSHSLVGSGASASCVTAGTTIGGGYFYSTPSPTPSPTLSPSVSPSVTPTPSPSISPSPSPSPSFTPTPAYVPQVAGVTDGSLIRSSNDYKIYIVKGSYKRWVQNQKIFGLYKHFKWSSVKIISAADLVKYTESSLVRAQGDTKVYEVGADGVKHWLNMTAEQFTQSGRSWNSIYVINKAEADVYKLGADIK